MQHFVQTCRVLYYGSSEILHHREYFGLADSHHLSVVSVLALLSAVISLLSLWVWIHSLGRSLMVLTIFAWALCGYSSFRPHAKDMQLVHLCSLEHQIKNKLWDNSCIIHSLSNAAWAKPPKDAEDAGLIRALWLQTWLLCWKEVTHQTLWTFFGGEPVK